MRVRLLSGFILVLVIAWTSPAEGQHSQSLVTKGTGTVPVISSPPPFRENLSYISRTVRASFNRSPIREVLEDLSSQTGARFSYADGSAFEGQVVTLVATNMTLGQVLDRILEGTSVSWLARPGGQIVLLPEAQAEQEAGRIAGTVKDSRSGEGIPSANVVVEGTGLGASTDPNGNFTITRVPPGDYTVTARSMGYRKGSSRVTVTSGGQARTEFSLESTVVNMDEVVVTGMSVATEKRQLGNSISTLNAADLHLGGVASVDRAMAGKVPGALIQQNSGSPDGGTTVRLRGTATVLGSADPLYILDGVIINNESPVLMFLGGYTQNRLIDINPNDIDHIEVVKGAAAAALYGSQANNGVIQIFTKHGTEGPPQVTFSTRVEMDQLRHRLPMDMAPVDNTGKANPDGSPVKRYDWQDFVFRNAVGTEQYLSVSGGSATSRYYASGSYLGNQGILRGTNFNRANGRASISQFLTDAVTLSFDANYAYDKSREVPNGGLESSYGALTGVLYGPNTVDPRRDPATGLYPHNVGLTNPVEVTDLYNFNQQVSRFIGSARVEANLGSGFSGNYTLGYDTYKQTANAYIPIGTARASVAQGFSRKGTRDFLQLTNDISFRYLHEFSPGFRSTSLIGGTLQYQNAATFAAEGSRLTPGSEVVTSGSLLTLSDFRSEVVIYGAFAQESFTLADRLTLTGGLRLDGSSVFGVDERTQLYPKASISYLISEEPFWRSLGLTEPVSSLKLRAAYGESGGLTAIGAFDRFTLYNPVSLGGSPGLVPATQLGASSIKPERQRGVEAGMDMGLFNDRVGIEFTYYNQKTRDLLLFRSVAPSTGFLSQLSNVGVLDNQGVELSLRVIPIYSRDLHWTSVLTYAANRNKVSGIQGGTLLIAESFGLVAAINGEPLGVYYGSAFKRDAAGHIVTDANGIPQADPAKKIIGDPNPKGMASWINDFDLPLNLSLHVQFDAIWGNDVFNFSRRVMSFPSYGTSTDYQKELNGQLPKGYNAAVYNIFENFIEDGSYVKCREVSISYSLPAGWLGTKSLRLTLAGHNLFSIDNYSGYDPETNVAGQRTAVRGFDFAEVPIPRGYSFSLTLGL